MEAATAFSKSPHQGRQYLLAIDNTTAGIETAPLLPVTQSRPASLEFVDRQTVFSSIRPGIDNQCSTPAKIRILLKPTRPTLVKFVATTGMLQQDFQTFQWLKKGHSPLSNSRLRRFQAIDENH